MGNALKADCSAADAYLTKLLSSPAEPWYISVDFMIPAATITALAAQEYTADLVSLEDDGTGTVDDGFFLTGDDTSGGSHNFSSGNTNYWAHLSTANPVNGGFTPDVWHTVKVKRVSGVTTWTVDGVDIITHSHLFGLHSLKVGGWNADHTAGEVYWIRNVTVGTTLGGTDLFHDDFASGNTSAWTSTDGDATVVSDPIADPSGRVLIAFDDGPLVANPTWTVLDQGDPFPENFVSGYDTSSGRQTLISQTETGTATVYINDRAGLLDDRNDSSPYQGKLSGRQIQLQLWNPVTSIWEPQFRGLIDDYTYDIDGSAVDANGDPINASIQIDCVDVFDYLNGYGLTPGLDGIVPPAGAEDSVYYAATSGTVDDRIIEILTDVGIDSTMYIVASGNVKVVAAKYDPDESALTALRDAADAELPFIANMYVNRSGQFVFRGRYSRFDPDAVAAEPGSDWDFTRWGVGDGNAIQSDPTRAQMRVLSYSRDRAELINAAICYTQGIKPTLMPNQVYADTSSITAYGKHAAQPMSDLLTSTYAGPGTISPDDGDKQCALYAELLVKNKKDPRICPTALQLKSINPIDFRASATWDVLTRSDISHIVNVAAGYPGGTGLTGAATADDYYIEGRSLTVRPANTSYDYVELDLEVSAFVWSADTHNVFPPFGS